MLVGRKSIAGQFRSNISIDYRFITGYAMKIFGKRTHRAWDALIIRYPIFQILETNSYLFYLIGTLFLTALVFAVIWSWGIPQKLTNTEPLSGVPDNLLSTIIEISAISILVVLLIFFKIFLGSEGKRVATENFRAVADSLILPLSIDEHDVRISFSQQACYKLPDFIEAFWRWSRVNREEYFLVEAGSLDIAKLAVRSIRFTDKFDSTTIELGQTSFFDIFFTHYCPDLTVSRVQHSDSEDEKTMRWLLSGSLSAHYKDAISAIKRREKNELNTADYLPSPLGMSGIVLLEVNDKKYAILRRRNVGDVAARGAIEWSFAGLFESTDWLHTNSIEFRKLVAMELGDELLKYSSTLSEMQFSLKVIGIVINELYLFQPELFSLCRYICSEDQLKAVCEELAKADTEKIWLTEVEGLDETFSDAAKCKNLCAPGLQLLKKQL